MSEFILRPLELIFIPTMLYSWATRRRWRARVEREIPSSFAARRWFLICLLINDPDVSFHSTCEREIDTRGAFVVIAGQRRNQFAPFRRILIWLQIWRKNDMLGQNYRTIAKQRHGSHGVAQFAKVSAPPMVKQLLHRFGMNCRDAFALLLIQPLSTPQRSMLAVLAAAHAAEE